MREDKLLSEALVAARSILDHVTYRKGVSFAADLIPSIGQLNLRMNMKTEDVNDPNRISTLTIDRPVNPYLIIDGEGYMFFMQILWSLIEEGEAHERMEWLRVDGRPIYDPHPNGTSATYPDFTTPRGLAP